MRRNFFPAIAVAALLSAPSAGAQDESPEREPAPRPGPLRPFVLPEIREARLANGVRVVVVERHALPIVHAQVIVKSGAVYEPAGKSGLAALTGTLLVEGGAAGMTSAELAQRIEAIGAQVGTLGGYALSATQATSLSNVFPQAFELAAAAIRSPMFDEREFVRVKNQALAAYARTMASAEGVADRTFLRAMYDPDAPYARSPAGTATTLGAITRDDVLNWHATMFAPARTTILFVGDIGFDAAVALATRLFGDWSVPAPDAPLPPNPFTSAAGPRVILVDRPGSVQSSIYVGVPGIARPDPEFFRMTVLDRILGGGFSSRILMNLRERRGFTYGAFTSLTALHNAGTFYATSSVRTDATDSSLVEVMREFRTIASEPVPEAELEAALTNLIASFPASLQSVQELASRMQTLLLYDMALDYYATYRERLAAVTAADVLAAAQARLNPAAITMVVVGDLARIEAPVRAANLGTVEVWDREGNRLR